jgi:hypothetical protein
MRLQVVWASYSLYVDESLVSPLGSGGFFLNGGCTLALDFWTIALQQQRTTIVY